MKKENNIGEITMDALRFIESQGRIEDDITVPVDTVIRYLDTEYGVLNITKHVESFINNNLSHLIKGSNFWLTKVEISTMSDTLLFALVLSSMFNIEDQHKIKYEYESTEDECRFLYCEHEYRDTKKENIRLVDKDIKNIRIRLGSYNYKLILSLDVTYNKNPDSHISNMFGIGFEIVFSYVPNEDQILSIGTRSIHNFNPINVFGED